MNKRTAFQYKILAIMLVIMVLVSITGIYAYKRFSQIVTSISKEARVDMRLITAKALMNDVAEAENSVKSYSLIRDTLYLNKFYKAAERSNEKLSRLHNYSADKKILSHEVDTLEVLIAEKFNILNELLVIQDKYRVQTALDKVVINIEKKDSIKEESFKIELKPNIIQKIFGKKNKHDTSIKTEKQYSIEDINKEIDSIKKEEKNIETVLKNQELTLLVQDKEVSKRIKNLLNAIEAKELLSIAIHTEEAEKAMKETNTQIAIFCVLTALLLVIMAYIIINYVQNSARYRKILKRAKAKAEDLAVTKERFLANMSHEIRTPMNAIAGFTEQIDKGPLTSEQKEQLTMVRKSIDHLLYLINDVLDFTKLQSGKLKLESIGFRPNEFVKDVITFVQPLAKEKQIEIKCDIKTDDELILLGDPFRLRQILLNLISNSIKFTEKGSISVQLSQVMKSSHFTNIRLEITDSGIGMNKDQLKKVFREFEQAEVSTSRNYGGTGLGLSIVSMLVKLHEGKIDIISSPNKGTTVSVEISYPLGTEAEIELYEKVEKECETNLSLPEGLKILIVDDEEYNRKLLSTILKKYPVSYTEAINGVEAIMEVKRNNYDLILMDARMPKMDGIEATKRIRQMNSEIKSNVPIIALTAAVTEDNKKEYKFAGMNGCLAKPFKEKELLQEINNLIELNNNIDSTEVAIDSEKEANSLDLTALKELSNGDKAFYTDMLQTFLQTTTTGIREMEKLLKEKNYAMVAEHAHKISAPCKHLGADFLYEHLKTIEDNCRNNKSLDEVDALITNVKSEFKTINELINKELSKN
jgi:signal transduction histidine kinase/CheY-like chemotaxis protein/HPt (histidine-containing phosphotransfer) domain-containing protein